MVRIFRRAIPGLGDRDRHPDRRDGDIVGGECQLVVCFITFVSPEIVFPGFHREMSRGAVGKGGIPDAGDVTPVGFSVAGVLDPTDVMSGRIEDRKSDMGVDSNIAGEFLRSNGRSLRLVHLSAVAIQDPDVVKSRGDLDPAG
jgi:hypothetical protein